MKKLTRLWGLVRLAISDLRARQSVKEALYLLSSLTEMPPEIFSRGISVWTKRLKTLQPYLYSDPEQSRLPDNLALLDDYPAINRRIQAEIASLPNQPLITFLVPVYTGPNDLIEATLKSIRLQLYSRFEVYLLTEGDRHAELQRMSAEIFPNSQPVILRGLVDAENLSKAFNEVLNECKGDFIGFVSASDIVARECTLEVVRLINQFPDVEIIYSDEGRKAGEYAIRSFRKPGWSRDLFLSFDYLRNFLCLRKEAVVAAGGFSGSFESDIKYDAVLRLIEKRERVAHLPTILYQGEVFKSLPQGYDADKSLALHKKSLAAHLDRIGDKAEIANGITRGSVVVRRQIKPDSKISIIIPTRDKIDLLKRCIESIEQKSTFRNYEIIIVDNGSVEPATLGYFAEKTFQILSDDAEFNFSRLNNLGARNANGNHLLFLNNDTEVISADWLEALLEHSQRAEVGAVGAKLLYPNGLIQHAGIVLGGPNVSEHINLFGEMHSHGDYGLADVVRNFSAVTGACLMMRANVFREIGGFDEQLAVTYNDVDLCLKARAAGYLVVYTPYAVLYHREGVSVLKKDNAQSVSIELSARGRTTIHRLQVPKGQARQIELFYSRWKSFIENDVNYDPQLADRSSEHRL
jgi:O-antigen biosynthesis protein